MEPEFANQSPIDSERRDPMEAAYGDVTISVETRIGSIFLPVRKLLELRIGAVIETQKVVGEPMDIYMEGRLMARGEVVVVNERYGVRVTEVVRPDEFDTSMDPASLPRGHVTLPNQQAAAPETGKPEETPPKAAKAAKKSAATKRDAEKAAKPARGNKRAKQARGKKAKARNNSGK